MSLDFTTFKQIAEHNWSPIVFDSIKIYPHSAAYMLFGCINDDSTRVVVIRSLVDQANGNSNTSSESGAKFKLKSELN